MKGVLMILAVALCAFAVLCAVPEPATAGGVVGQLRQRSTTRQGLFGRRTVTRTETFVAPGGGHHGGNVQTFRLELNDNHHPHQQNFRSEFRAGFSHGHSGGVQAVVGPHGEILFFRVN